MKCLIAGICAIVTLCSEWQSENIFAVRGRIEGGGETLTLGAPVTGTISQVLVKAGIMFTPARAC
jgi:hypothetical protein